MKSQKYIPTIYPLNYKLTLTELYTIFSKEEDLSFLDSGEKEDLSAQYSFLCFHGFSKIYYQNAQTYIDNQKVSGEFFQNLKNTNENYIIENNTSFPFVGGAVGYVSYDYSFVGFGLKATKKSYLNEKRIPLCFFNLYDTVIIYEHSTGNSFLSCLGIKNEKSKQHQYITDKIQEFEGTKTRANNTNFNFKRENLENKFSYSSLEENKAPLTSDFSKQEYLLALSKVKDYIKLGHVYIMNMTHQLHGNTQLDSTMLYSKLRAANSAPFSGHLRYGNHEILSTSPERFISVYNKKVKTCPIKGTVKRSDNLVIDRQNKEYLLNSEKDKSELLMIVDLERNDLSKTCKPYSVKTNRLFELETYETVHHLVAEVEGVLEENQTAIDCLKECFPGGSITGAPKERAIEIIDELEKTPRGIYTGSMGYVGFDGNADFNIVIRTLHLVDQELILGVGGGITWESDLEMEYYETLDKASRILEVIASCKNSETVGEDTNE